MSDTELKPCPFCGGEVKLDEDEFDMFFCDACGAGITFAKELQDGGADNCDKEESIEKWNTRKPMERIVELLEELPHGKYVDDYGNGFSAAINVAIEIVKGGAE